MRGATSWQTVPSIEKATPGVDLGKILAVRLVTHTYPPPPHMVVNTLCASYFVPLLFASASVWAPRGVLTGAHEEGIGNDQISPARLYKYESPARYSITCIPLVSDQSRKIEYGRHEIGEGVFQHEGHFELGTDYPEYEHHDSVSERTRKMVAKHFHHYDFWGQEAPTKNETDPAVSLAVLTAPAKNYMAEGQFEVHPRKFIVAWQAHRYLDPVVYTGDFEALQAMSIRERRESSVGEVFKFYTQHGSWQWEDLDEDDHQPVVDGELFEEYPTGHTIINGFVCDKGQPTHASLHEDMDDAVRVAKKRRDAFASLRRASGRSNSFGPSRLSKIHTPESMLAEEAEHEARLLDEQKESETVRAHYSNKLLKPSTKDWSSLDSDSDSDGTADDDDDDDLCHEPHHGHGTYGSLSSDESLESTSDYSCDNSDVESNE